MIHVEAIVTASGLTARHVSICPECVAGRVATGWSLCVLNCHRHMIPGVWRECVALDADFFFFKMMSSQFP